MGFEYMGELEEVWRMWKLGGGDWSEGSLGTERVCGGFCVWKGRWMDVRGWDSKNMWFPLCKTFFSLLYVICMNCKMNSVKQCNEAKEEDPL